ncbi:MAG: hypothetical protein ACN6OP_26825 [Pseudomonadales bacterium]
MDWWNRFALWLWRDRGGYDVEAGCMSEDYNRSLRTRFRSWRYENEGRLLRSAPWLITTVIALAAAIPAYLDRAKADQQVQTYPGELLLRCTQEPDNVLRCRPVAGGKGKDKVIARPDGGRLDKDRSAEK